MRGVKASDPVAVPALARADAIIRRSTTMSCAAAARARCAQFRRPPRRGRGGDVQMAECRVLDGVVVGKAIRTTCAAGAAGRGVARAPAGARHRPGRRRSGLGGLRPQQGQDGRRVGPDRRPDRGCPRPRRSTTSWARCGGSTPARSRRHPRAVAAAGGAGAARRDDGVRDHRPGQGRRRLQPGERRPARPEPRHAALVHAGRA